MIHFLRSFKYGGIEKLVGELFLPDVDTLVVVSDDIDQLSLKYVQDKGAEVRFLNCNRIYLLPFSAEFWRFLLRKESAVFWYEELAFFSIFRFFFQTKIHLGTIRQPGFKTSIYNSCLRVLGRLGVISIICCSEQVKKSKALGEYAKVVYNYVGLPQKVAVSKVTENQGIFVGRWEPIKNPNLILKFWTLMEGKVNIRVYGDVNIRKLKEIEFAGTHPRPFDNSASCRVALNCEMRNPTKSTATLCH